jgi:hypothetical protein
MSATREEQIRVMLMEGRSVQRILREVRTSFPVIKRIRDALGPLKCRCGLDATHVGSCSWRAKCRRRRRNIEGVVANMNRARLAKYPPKPKVAAPGRRLRNYPAPVVYSAEQARRLGSAHCGTVGFRVMGMALTLISLRITRKCARKCRFKARLMDDAGNLFDWSGKQDRMPEHGKTVFIDGTVKDHVEDCGQKVTVITRCEFVQAMEALPVNDADPERDLVLRIEKGDHAAFSILHERYFKRAARFAMSIVHEWATAEDIAQDTLLTAWNVFTAGRYKRSVLLENFILCCARHRALSELARRRREGAESFEDKQARHAMEPSTEDAVWGCAA